VGALAATVAPRRTQRIMNQRAGGVGRDSRRISPPFPRWRAADLIARNRAWWRGRGPASRRSAPPAYRQRTLPFAPPVGVRVFGAFARSVYRYW